MKVEVRQCKDEQVQYFYAPVSGQNEFKTLPALFRAVADWMEQNNFEDQQLQHVAVNTNWPNIDSDDFNYTATVYFSANSGPAGKPCPEKSSSSGNEVTRQEELNEIISDNLWGTRADPEENNLRQAAKAYQKLKTEGLQVDSEESVVRVLTRNNIYATNFLE